MSKENPQSEGEPYYPIPNNDNDLLYREYYNEAMKIKDVIFIGRLAEYKYYNMDEVVGRVLKKFV